MDLHISVGSAYYDGSDWDDLVTYVQHADKICVTSVWSAEAWGMEAVSSLGYLAHATKSIKLGSGIMQLSARTPATTAMTALSLNQISKGRFVLGLGASGPQVVEGLHGAPFARPLERLREYVTIVRQGLSGERLNFEGAQYVLPRPGGEGKALKLSLPPKPDLPIYLATLGEKSLELTGEIANGWMGTSFVSDRSEVLLDPIKKGAERAGRALSDIDLMINAVVLVSEDVESLIQSVKPRLAFSLGGMGSAKTNFYNAAYARSGFEDVAEEVQSLWIAGKRDQAVAAVPDEMVLRTTFIGTEDMVRDRIRDHAAVGINGLRVGPTGKTARDKIEHLEKCADLIKTALE